MKKKLVRITYPLPKAVYGMTVTGRINNKDGSQAGNGSFLMDGDASVPDVEVNRTIQPTSREHATLEAELGETVVTGLDQANSGGIPEFYTVGGNRHHAGGTPLNLPPDSFIFSRDRKMSIKDPEILAQFGKSVGKKGKGKKKYTFADLSKSYDINPFRKILADPSSDKHQIDTAQIMIQNYNLKLGGLAMVQESMKGFPDGVPGISMPYLEHVGMDPSQFFPQEEQQPQQQMRWGGMPNFQTGGPSNEGFVPPADDLGETITKFDWTNVTNPTDYLADINQQSSDAGIARSVDKEAFFNQWNTQPQAKNLQYGQPDADTWSPVPQETAPAKEKDPFTPQTRYVEPTKNRSGYYEGKMTGTGDNWKTVSQDRYFKKYDPNFDKATFDADPAAYAAQFNTNAQQLQNQYNNAQPIPGQPVPQGPSMASNLSLKQMGGNTLPSYKYEGEVQEADYTYGEGNNESNFDPSVYTNAIQPDANAPVEQDYYSPTAAPVAPGTVPELSTKSTKYQNIPSSQALEKEGKAKWDITAEGYDEAQVEAGDYVKKSDGKWYEVKGYSTKNTAYTGDFADERLIGKVGDNQESFGRIQQRINENDELRDAIIKQYRDTISKAKPGKNLTEADLSAARGMSDDEVIENFYDFQKQIMAVHAHKGQQFNKDSDLWDKDRSQYENTIIGLRFEPKNTADTAAFQATYIAMQNLADKGKHKKDLEDFQIMPWGKGDEKGGGTGIGKISDIDGWVGDTTIGQGTYYDPKAKELQMEEAAWKEAKKTPEVKHLGLNQGPQKTPFWTEDIINLAGATRNLYGIQRETPWNAVPGMKLPDATFMSPDQQIQNILGASGQGTKMAGVFGSPQGFGANFANIHGNAMQQVANAIGNVQDKNVQVANQFELQRANIMNRSNERRAQLATNLHDKNAILNQQFSNAKNQAWNEVREGMVNMWTNRGMTQNLNTFNDQYYIDPQTGYKHFRDPREMKPKDANNNSVALAFQNVKSVNPGIDDRVAYKMAKDQLGMPDTSPTGFMGVDPEQTSPAYPGGQPSGYQ